MLTDAQGPQPPATTKTAFKNPLLYSSLLVGIVLLFVVWTLFSRCQENLAIERRWREEKTRKQLDDDRVALEQFGGKELATQSFYAIPAAIHTPESAQLSSVLAHAKP